MFENGNPINRLMEGKNFLGRELKVLDDITMYHKWDRSCYYITEVINQKNIKVRRYRMSRATWAADPKNNSWIYEMDDSADEEEWQMINGHWCSVVSRNIEDITKLLSPIRPEDKLKYLTAYYKYTSNEIGELVKGKTVKHFFALRDKVSFGVRDYCCDWRES